VPERPAKTAGESGFIGGEKRILTAARAGQARAYVASNSSASRRDSPEITGSRTAAIGILIAW
jgi:hypothetical protein